MRLDTPLGRQLRKHKIHNVRGDRIENKDCRPPALPAVRSQ
jgi:hypothetical protein